jgi:hypothetical protein
VSNRDEAQALVDQDSLSDASESMVRDRVEIVQFACSHVWRTRAGLLLAQEDWDIVDTNPDPNPGA